MFKDNNVEEGYPRPVSDFGLPSGGVDAAFSWAHNDKTYFFKDQLYWRYDEHTRRMDPGHPAQSPPWRGVPSTLDDAMRWSDGEPGKGESLAASASPLGEWVSGGTGGACPASLATDLPRAALAHSSGACSPLPSSLLAPVTLTAVTSSPLAATQACASTQAHTPRPLHLRCFLLEPYAPHTHAAPPPPASVLSNVLAALPACSEKYTTFLQAQFSRSVPSDSLRPPWTAEREASLSIPISRSLLKLVSIASVMPSNHLILCRPFSSGLQSLPSIRVFSNEVFSSHVAKVLEFQLQHQSYKGSLCSSFKAMSPASRRVWHILGSQ